MAVIIELIDAGCAQFWRILLNLVGMKIIGKI
jgi:hypothetical protein